MINNRAGLRNRTAGLPVSAVTLFVLTLFVVLVPAASAGARTYGIVPPHNPKADCARSYPVAWSIREIDRCRAKESIGPMRLPSNWSHLNVERRMFVLLNLERVNRGLAPIVGLSRTLNRLAQRGANADADPGFPSSGAFAGGSVWAGTPTLVGADEGWMYDDGPNGLDLNMDCRTPNASGCWGHRDVILMRSRVGPLVGGAGYARHRGYGSFAFEILSGYSRSGLTFTWAHELRFFAHLPGGEPLARPASARR